MLKFIDLFAGMGGLRLGVTQACNERNIHSECVFTSEIKKHAIDAYNANFNEQNSVIDITMIDPTNIPDHDLLLAGFPCQAFSHAGKRLGFEDLRGTLFFNVANILKTKQPNAFILENVEGLTTHDRGRTFQIILETLHSLNYHVDYKILNSLDFSVPQNRKRIYLVGQLKNNTKNVKPVSLDFTPSCHNVLNDILDNRDHKKLDLPIADKLLEKYDLDFLQGKSIKDKRGGENNIHSWDLEIKGKISDRQRILLEQILKQRRRKIWAEIKGIEWMDGMPLTLNEIHSFSENTYSNQQELRNDLDDLINKKYLVLEHPKKKHLGKRIYDETKEKGYNIVTGKLSFPISQILDKTKPLNTLVATDLEKLAISDEENGKPFLRRLSQRELLRASGFPDDYIFPANLTNREVFDLIGNTVSVPVIKNIVLSLLNSNYF